MGKAAMQKDDTLETMTHERLLLLDLFKNVFKENKKSHRIL